MPDELLSSFDHLKSLPTSRENNHLLLKRHLRIFDKFVKDPHTVGKVGQVPKVKVLEVDEKRKRIALTMRLTDAPASQIQEARGIGKREQSRDRKDRSADSSRNGKPDLIQRWGAFARLGRE